MLSTASTSSRALVRAGAVPPPSAAARRRRGGPAVGRARRPPAFVAAAAAAPSAPAASSSAQGDLEVADGGGGAPSVEVSAIHSPEELTTVLSAYPERVVVLMCKASSCRPCKMFMRKYERIAASYAPDAVFLVITGDESKETRGMMMAMAVRVTPTFFLWDRAPGRSTEPGPGGGPPPTRTATGVNENNLKAAVDAVLAGQGAEG